MVGASTGAIAVPLAAIVANRWFARRRGMVTGLLTASNASGQLVFLPLLAWIVTAYSWRTAALVIAATALLVVARWPSCSCDPTPPTSSCCPMEASRPSRSGRR